MPGVICFAGSFIFVLTRLRISYFPLTVIIYVCVRYVSPTERDAWYGMVWCLFIQHQRTSYIAQITHDAEREMHEV